MQIPSLTKQINLETVSSILVDTPSVSVPSKQLKKAAVATLLSGNPPFEVFFIIRARHSSDPWSGDIGFPGGKLEPGEAPRESAERETYEEVAIDLSNGNFLGYLEPITGAHLPIEINCLVYHLDQSPAIRLNHEVSKAFWFRIDKLLQPHRFGDFPVMFGRESLVRPGIAILPEGGPILWGITYRLLTQFFTKLGIPFPPTGST